MPNWTDEQISAINAVGKGVIVSAAAGSGKTAVLIERTIRLLCDCENKIPVEKLLAVTFTNDAASQLREKLTVALNQKIEENPENQWLLTQQLNLQRARISTINSFCFDIVKNNIDKFDISSGVRILDDVESETILQNSLEAVFEDCYKNNSEMMTYLFNCFCKDNDNILMDYVKKLYNFSLSLPFKEKWFNELLSGYEVGSDYYNKWLKILKEYLIDNFEILFSYVKEAYSIATTLTNYSKTMDVIGSDFAQVDEIKNSDFSNLDDVLSKLNSFKFATFGSKPDDKTLVSTETEKPLVEKIKALRDTYKNEIKDLATSVEYKERYIEQDLAENKKALSHLLFLVQNLEQKVWEEKVERNAIDFSDVEIMSVKLLSKELGDKFVRSDLAKEILSEDRYAIVLIDEFQDVNNLQDTIFKLLSKGDNLDFIGENVFVVGDVKQSIYRFRQANPNIFISNRKLANLATNSEVLEEINLRKNFRSRKNVIDFVNFVFKGIMSEEIGEVEYNSDEQLVLGANYPENPHSTEILLCSPENEYQVIVNRIKQMIKDKVLVFDEGEMRPCRQKDFCILVRSGKKQGKLAINAIKEGGLSPLSEEMTGYLRSPEISLLINILNVIDNPMEEIPLVSVMYCPVFAFSDDDIATIRFLYQKERLYTGIISYKNEGEDLVLREKCGHFLSIIKKLRVFSTSANLETLIRKIYDTTDMISLTCLYNDSEQKRANLRLLIDYANTFDETVSGGVGGFLRYINRVFDIKKDFKQAGIVFESSDAITVKTIHKSKGLEYPFVFMCGLSSEFSGFKLDINNSIQINLDSGIGFKFKNNQTLEKYTTMTYCAVQMKNRNELLSEEMRLLYVALTRAKEKLILTFAPKENAKKKYFELANDIRKSKGVVPAISKKATCFLDWIFMSLLQEEKSNPLKEKYLDFDIGNYLPCDSKIEFISACEDGELLSFEEEITEVKSYKYLQNFELEKKIRDNINFSYEEIDTKLAAKVTVSEISKESEDFSLSFKIADLSKKSALSPTEKGIATHLFMQFANFENAEKDVTKEALRLVGKGHLTKKQSGGVDIFTLENFFASEFYGRMKNSQNVMREKQFLVMIDDLSIENNDILSDYQNTDGMLQGVADCIFEEEDGYVLVDYKTDRVKDISNLIENYSFQLQLYKSAFDTILDKPIKSCYIYSFHLTNGIELHFDEK